MALLGCTVFEPTLVGSGVAGQETRPLAPFERLAISAPAKVTVRIAPAAEVRLAFDENLLPHVETVVEHGELEIRLAGGTRYRSSKPLVVEVLTPTLSGLSIAGSAEVQADALASTRFGISVAGSGSVRAAGRVEELVVSIAGSGDLDLCELQAERVEVDIAGSGDVELHAAKTLEVSLAGSGRVRYLGAPAIWSSSVAGSGSVSALAP